MMQGYLTPAQISYVLYHLNLVVVLDSAVHSRFVFLKDSIQIENHNNKILFILSEKPLDKKQIVRINNIPILYPYPGKTKIAESGKNNNLIFWHDLFKSAFILLSGYYEYKSKERDSFNRFPYSHSLQKELDIISIPVVNYYFEFIINHIEEYLNTKLERRKLFNNFGLVLTHDIDRIRFYSVNNLLYKIKQFFSLAPSKFSRKKILHYCRDFLLFHTRIKNIRDPIWDFEELIKKEEDLGYKSAFYFLSKDLKNIDSEYYFDNPKIRSLFSELNKKKVEIGLHGSVRTAEDPILLKGQKQSLEYHCNCQVIGGRQHRLVFHIPHTGHYFLDAGLHYDTSLGFAEHIGFRNSFCLPFKFFDFSTDTMLPLWEIPLTVMDTTLFFYQNLKPEKALQKVEDLILESKKFHGIITLLWHNGFETDLPGIITKEFYNDLLSLFNKHKAQNMLPSNLITKLP